MLYYRGLILVHPHGTYIKEGKKKTIIKSVNLSDISHKPLLLIENKIGLGIIYLDDPIEITIKEFKNKYNKHRITEKERIEWWKNKRKLYEYKITKKNIFKRPIKLNYKMGPQIVVKPENIWKIRPKKIYIGTSGYQYKLWRNKFYPKGLSVDDEFKYYAKKFNSVEINYSFYNIPTKEVAENWYWSSPYDFIYSVKMSRYIIYYKDTKKYQENFKKFTDSMVVLDDKLGAIMIHTSRKYKLNDKNMTNIKMLLKNLRKDVGKIDIAVEFRNKDWFSPKVYAVLKKYNASIVINHVNNKGKWAGNLDTGFNPPLENHIPTADFVYVRLHGPVGKYVGLYDTKTLRQLVNFLEKVKVKRAYVYFNNTDSMTKGLPDAVKNGLKLQKMIK